MKKVIYSLMLLCFTLGFTACEDETSQDTSKITYYATLDLQGETTLFWELGKEYVEPGYYAELQGEDVTDQVVVKGEVDVNTPGIYPLTYVITNVDGFSVTKSRTVMVADITPSPIASGFWTASSDSYRDYNGQTSYGSEFQVIILQTAPGKFYISDFLGGWYDQRAGYGSAYAMEGHFQLNADNTITPIDSYVAGWGDSMEEMVGGKYDPATGEISWMIDYSESHLKFYVTLKL
ncbi:BT_2262 family domain-containing protein [uncultured Bacteroides sp.]|uniref:BT_2262 family domain-containing protein n=1 Tax=uncultured Bacteroides sp. TaxID=162156 RepID=UPI002611A6DC|nr:BT_2262 family domain-containing protein [uncultured Bacteroides sp.]